MKKFSIVVITYQNKRMIKACLESLNCLKGLDRSEYEIIIVDDGSSDGTGEYIKSLDTNYHLKYIYLERCADSCRSRARNHGWRSAEGEVVAFIDSDIILRPDYLLELERCYSMEKDIMVSGLRMMLPKDASLEGISDGSIFKRYAFNPKDTTCWESRHYMFKNFSYNVYSISDPWFMVIGCNSVIPRKWLEKTGGYDENFKVWAPEDVDMTLRLYKEGVKVVLNPKLTILHQYHPEGGSTTDADVQGKIGQAIAYFLDKHPDVFASHYSQAIDYFKGVSVDFISRNVRAEPLPRRVVEFRDKSALEKVKETILTLSGRRGIELVVVDHVEDTDLDIWIQLLGFRNCTPKYFPVSALHSREA